MSDPPAQVVLLYRRVFYAVLVLWSSLLVTFTVIRLVYTIQPRRNQLLFDGKSFYGLLRCWTHWSRLTTFLDPAVAELCFCGLLTISYCSLMLFVLQTRIRRTTLSRNWFEVTCSAILWTLWLGGTAASSAKWSELNFCVEYVSCKVLQAMLAFAWLGWIFITVQLGITVFILAHTGDWDGHIFERPEKPVTAEEDSSYMEQKASSELDAIPWSYREGRSQRTDSCRLSSFSAVVPHWLAWSDIKSSPRSSMAPTTPASRQQSRQTRRKSSLATYVTFDDQGRTNDQSSPPPPPPPGFV